MLAIPSKLRVLSVTTALAALLLAATVSRAVPMFSSVPAPTEGVTNDIFDVSQGTQVIIASQLYQGLGDSDPRAALGLTSAFIEPLHANFADAAPAGNVDFIDFQTPTAINLSSFELRLKDDGGSARSATNFALLASQDGVNFSVVSSGALPGGGAGYSPNPLLVSDNALVGTTQAVRAFRLQLTRAAGQGPRIYELDAVGTPTAAVSTFVDRLLFNATTNSLTGSGAADRDDEGPGLGINFSASPGIGADNPVDVFGNRNGAIEPYSYIFNDNGVADNGNMILGDGGETVDFIQWQTSSPVTLAGYRIDLAGDGGGPNRATELVAFYVNGVQVDFFDNNAAAGPVSRFFALGPVTGDTFRAEFTRTTNGERIFEIDAILAAPVPEPASMTLLAFGGLALLRRRKAA